MARILKLILILHLSVTGFAQKYKLEFNLKKGETYHQKMICNANVNQDLNGNTMNVKMNISGEMTYRVTDIINSDFVMEVMYEKLTMTMNTGQGETLFSSESVEESDIVSRLLSKLTHKPFNITFTKLGKVKEVKNLELLFNGMFDGFPELTDEQKEQIKSQLEKSYGPESFKANMEMGSAIFAGYEVAKGEQWLINTNLDAGIKAKLATTYQLKEVGETYYVISGNSILESLGRDTFVETNGMPMKYDMGGSMTSEIKISKITGWIMEANITQKMKGKAEIKANPKVPEGMTIPMEMTIDMWIME